MERRKMHGKWRLSFLQVTRDAGPVKGGTTVIAFVKDPAGYMWELIQRPKESPEPICQVRAGCNALCVLSAGVVIAFIAFIPGYGVTACRIQKQK